jgi:hypothetical protein
MRRPLAALVLATALAGGLVATAPAANACQPESCPPPCPFTGKLGDLLCPQPV